MLNAIDLQLGFSYKYYGLFINSSFKSGLLYTINLHYYFHNKVPLILLHISYTVKNKSVLQK